MTAHDPTGEVDHACLPCLVIAASQMGEALAYYERAFGAERFFALTGPDGRIVHAEIHIGRAAIMLGAAHPDMGFHPPRHYGGTPVSMFVYVPDVDAFAARAVAAGAVLDGAIENQFYGDRIARFTDPFGHQWRFGARVEKVDHETIQRRFDAMMTE